MKKVKATSKRSAATPERRIQLILAARGLCSQGFKILALKPRTKQPMTPHGVKDATSNISKFMHSVEGCKDFNIGIATGPASAILVLDYDPRNGANKTTKELSHDLGSLPAGPVSPAALSEGAVPAS